MPMYTRISAIIVGTHRRVDWRERGGRPRWMSAYAFISFEMISTTESLKRAQKSQPLIDEYIESSQADFQRN
jgi:hypothetical protein